MKDKQIIIGVMLVAVLAVGLIVWGNRERPLPVASAAVTALAQCLTEKGAIMYGAYWCPNCQDEKEAFGDAFQYINYVECTKEEQLCKEKGITGYPTWDFADGQRARGRQGLEKLKQLSGC